jgi:hypothetical protein
MNYGTHALLTALALVAAWVQSQDLASRSWVLAHTHPTSKGKFQQRQPRAWPPQILNG